MNNIIEYLKNDPDCLYIYNRDFSIYGLPDKERYTIVVKDGWNCPEDWIGFDQSIYQMYTITDWFNKVTNGELIAWECSCLNRKYIIKELVKLPVSVKPIQLRNEVESLYNTTVDNDININSCYNIIRNCRFAIQIIENHKIVNYKDSLQDYKKLDNCDGVPEMWEVVNNSYLDLLSLTNGIKKQELLNKAKKNSHD